MSVRGRLATALGAVTLALPMVAAAPSVRAADGLLEPLRSLSGWLGVWSVVSGAEDAIRIEYRPSLRGQFVEAWYRDARTAELRAHSMIGAGKVAGSLVEYRFDDRGRLTVRDLDPAGGPVGARGPDTQNAASPATLDPSLDILRPMLGQWEVATDWLDGKALWAQMTNRAELGGHVVVSAVLAAQQGEAPYDRYRTFYFRDDAGKLHELTFTHRGQVVDEPFSVERSEHGPRLTTVYAPGSMAATGIRKQLVFVSERRMHWTDDVRSSEGEDWRRVIDAECVRVGAADPTNHTMPVDDTLFAASGSDLRSISIERVIDAAPAQVWDAWTSSTAWKAAYAPGRPDVRGNIDLAPGGRYEWLFDGAIGCNGCQVLSYLPPRMLSFTWNSPVSQPRSRVRRTWVVVEIETVDDGRSRIRLTQLGFGDGDDWDETRAYFAKAWVHVLDQMARNLARPATLPSG